MELRQLEYFRTIADTGSINEAARRLDVYKRQALLYAAVHPPGFRRRGSAPPFDLLGRSAEIPQKIHDPVVVLLRKQEHGRQQGKAVDVYKRQLHAS